MAKRKGKFIHRPVYPGGNAALQKFLREHLQYPKRAQENSTEGKVRVNYSIDQRGKVVKATAVEGPKDGCREEAVRLVKLLRFQVPKDYKMTIQYHQHLDINFKLPTPKTKKPSTRITYSIKPTKKKEPPTTPESDGYSYTIKW